MYGENILTQAQQLLMNPPALALLAMWVYATIAPILKGVKNNEAFGKSSPHISTPACPAGTYWEPALLYFAFSSRIGSVQQTYNRGISACPNTCYAAPRLTLRGRPSRYLNIPGEPFCDRMYIVELCHSRWKTACMGLGGSA
jgi:hypothetical protein